MDSNLLTPMVSLTGSTIAGTSSPNPPSGSAPAPNPGTAILASLFNTGLAVALAFVKNPAHQAEAAALDSMLKGVAPLLVQLL